MDLVAANEFLEDGPRLRAMADEQGYLLVRGLLPEAPLLRLRECILAAAAEAGWLDQALPPMDGIAEAGRSTPAHDDPQFTDLQVTVQLLPEFEAVRSHPALLEIMGHIFDGPVRTHCGDVCRLAFPGATSQPTPPHQDQYYLNAKAETWTGWMPLGECPRDLGALQVLPGSHRAGLIAHGAGVEGMPVASDATWATTDFSCGDVLMFHYLTVHGARANRDPRRIRVSVDCRYRKQ
jgi:ectoine hydroxylase-related dioxygenase (phytanoyl-CoA dioxygenase family)